MNADLLRDASRDWRWVLDATPGPLGPLIGYWGPLCTPCPQQPLLPLLQRAVFAVVSSWWAHIVQHQGPMAQQAAVEGWWWLPRIVVAVAHCSGRWWVAARGCLSICVARLCAMRGPLGPVDSGVGGCSWCPLIAVIVAVAHRCRGGRDPIAPRTRRHALLRDAGDFSCRR